MIEYKNLGKDDDGLAQLFAAIGQCQTEFPALPKSAKGQAGGGKFNYVPLDQIIEAMKPQLKEYGVTFSQLLHSDETATALTLLVTGHGALVSTTFRFARDRNPQDAGKQLTYYRRYQLTAFFGIVGDPDAASDSVEENKKRYQKKEEQDSQELGGEVADHNSTKLRIQTATSMMGLKNIWGELSKDEKAECKPDLEAKKAELNAQETETEREPGEEG